MKAKIFLIRVFNIISQVGRYYTYFASPLFTQGFFHGPIHFSLQIWAPREVN